MSTIGEYLINVLMTGINDGVGQPNTVNSFQVVESEGRLILQQGNPGKPGPQGPAAFPWKWRGDVADYVALQSIEETLNQAHKGYAYRVVGGTRFPNSVMYWDGETFYPFLSAFGAEGPRGETCTITVGTVETLAEGANAYINITGTPPNLTLNAGIPRGGQGEEGPEGGPGSIMASPDVNPAAVPVQDSTLVWDNANSRFDVMPYPAWKGPWTLSDTDFSSGSNVSAASSTIATKTIPPQSVRWRPYIEGGVFTTAHVSSVGAGRVDVEVRIGSATGQVVAIGYGFPAANVYRCTLTSNFGATLNPSSTVGTIAPNTTATLFVVIRRTAGSSNYTWSNSGANLIIYAQPVVAP